MRTLRNSTHRTESRAGPSASRHNVVRAAALVTLLAVGWGGQVAYLTAKEDRACGPTAAPTGSELEGVLARLSEDAGGVGLQASVVLPDGGTERATAGYADLEAKCPMSAEHHLFLGSVSKAYTAVMVMREVERGTIVLDGTLDTWLDLPYAGRVTVRMLLNHTSGVPAYTDDAGFLVRYLGLPAKRWRPDDMLRVIEDKPLGFEPGSRHAYSNSNYLLLGIVLERATGRPYAELLRDEMERLGLRHTFYLEYPPDLLIANGYDRSLLHLGTRNLTGFRRSLVSGAYAAGGILATAEDVARFLHALLAGQVISAPMLAEMTAFVDAPDEDVPLQDGYGLGLRRLHVDGRTWVGHTGTIPGYSGIAMHDATGGHTVVILSNRSVIDRARALAEVSAAILPADPRIESSPSDAKPQGRPTHGAVLIPEPVLQQA